MKKRFVSFCIVFYVFVLVGSAQAGLKDYVAKPDPTYTYEITDSQPVESCTADTVHLKSQTWQGMVWTHWLIIFRPAKVSHPDTALMLIGGGSIDSTPEYDSEEGKIARMIATASQSVVALLLQVPNEPLFNGLNEDEIIAYTYDKFMKGEGEDWPLLQPMVKSAVRGMDTIQAVMKDKYGQEIKGFVLTGGSKRGWTSWLTAASGDSRVKAIAPVVIDMLNLKVQMDHQTASYGEFSEQVDDYTNLDIQKRMGTPEGKKLLSIVDPYTYRDELTLPKLIILGSNDPYWTVDSANLYFPDLKGPKHLYYQANTGHDVSKQGVSTLAQFYNATLTGKPFPGITWKAHKGRIEVRWEDPRGKAILWQAESKTRDFRESEWKSTDLEGKGKASARVKAPKKGWTAFYVEVRCPGDFGFPYGLTTQMTVLPDKYPVLDGQKGGKADKETGKSEKRSSVRRKPGRR